MPKKSTTEQELLKMIKDAREEGVLQSELWKEVHADSREGSRAILRLEKKGLILREKELHQGRWTYRIKAKYQFSSINSIIDIPCVWCDIEDKCGHGGLHSPEYCERLTVWLKENINLE